jgi:Thiolase, C-terminal domain
MAILHSFDFTDFIDSLVSLFGAFVLGTLIGAEQQYRQRGGGSHLDDGAVAHGHPIGATGAVLTTKLIHSMRRDGLTRGVVSGSFRPPEGCGSVYAGSKLSVKYFSLTSHLSA